MTDSKMHDTIGGVTLGMALGLVVGMFFGARMATEIYRYEAIQAGCARYEPNSGNFAWVQQPEKVEVRK